MAKTSYKRKNGNGGLRDLFRELWNTAVTLRGSIEPADYKRYVLPLIFLRFLSLRYEKRLGEIYTEIADPKSDLHTTDKQLAFEIREDPDNFKKKNVFLVPEEAGGTTSSKSPAPMMSKSSWTTFWHCSKRRFQSSRACSRPFTPARILTRKALPALSIFFPRTSSAPTPAAWTCWGESMNTSSASSPTPKASAGANTSRHRA